MKNLWEGLSNRLDQAEDRINEHEDRTFEITKAEDQKEEQMKKNEESQKDLWDTSKQNSMHIMGVLKGEEREKGEEKLFEEIIAKKFPSLRNRHTS